MTVSALEFSEAVEKMQAFYAGIYSDLLTLMLGTVGLVAVVVPAGLAYLQTARLRREEASFKEEMRRHVSEVVEALKQDMDAKVLDLKAILNDGLDAKFEVASKDIERRFSEAKGSVFHLQAATAFSKGDYEVAAASCCDAAIGYIGANNHADLRVVCQMLHEACLPKMNQKSFDSDAEGEERIRRVIAGLHQADSGDTGGLRDLIVNIGRALRDAKARA